MSQGGDGMGPDDEKRPVVSPPEGMMQGRTIKPEVYLGKPVEDVEALKNAKAGEERYRAAQKKYFSDTTTAGAGAGQGSGGSEGGQK